MTDALDRLRAYCSERRIALVERPARHGELMTGQSVLVEDLRQGPLGQRRCEAVVCPERLAVAEWSPAELHQRISEEG